MQLYHDFNHDFNSSYLRPDVYSYVANVMPNKVRAGAELQHMLPLGSCFKNNYRSVKRVLRNRDGFQVYTTGPQICFHPRNEAIAANTVILKNANSHA